MGRQRPRAQNPGAPLTAIDLFAGCGGTTVGLKRAGFRVAAAVEIDPVAAESFMINHPDVIVLEDIRKVTGPALLEEVGIASGSLDLLVGCPPCQGFSSVRRLNGGRLVRDPNNSLLGEFLRLIRSIRPRAVMLENVPWLLNTAHFAAFRSGLRRMGYEVISAVKDAQDYGVPQRRKRAILIAIRDKVPGFGTTSRLKPVVRDAIGHLPAPSRSRDRMHNLPEKRRERLTELIRLIPRNGGSRGDLPDDDQLECHRKCNGFKDVYGRMAWGKVAPTITGGCFNPSKGRFLHPEQNRNISLREAALLQTFPARYYFPPDAGKQAVARLIGNALPPEFVRRHALEISRTLLGDSIRGRNGNG